MTGDTLRHLAPELILFAVAMGIYAIGLLRAVAGLWWVGAIGLAAAGIALTVQGDSTASSSLFVSDALALHTRWLACGVGLLLVLVLSGSTQRHGPRQVGSVLLATAGWMLAAMANDLIVLLVALEGVAIATYVLLWPQKNEGDSRAAEAPVEVTVEVTVKYVLLGILSSVVLLLGFCFLYGVTGTTCLAGSATRVAPAAGLIHIAIVLIVAGLGLRLAAAPFCSCVPDVFEGTTHFGAAALAILPKGAAMVALVRLLPAILVEVSGSADGFSAAAWRVFLLLAVLSMTFGNALALWQTNLRRLLAYLAIGQTGAMLLSIAVLAASGTTPEGASPEGTTVAMDGWFCWLVVYALAFAGLFAVFAHLGRLGQSLEDVEELAGLARTRPKTALAIALLLVSLTGIPPLAGFWPKLLVFAGCLDVGGELRFWFTLATVIAAVNLPVVAASTLRIVGCMYFRVPLATPKAGGGLGPLVAATVSAVLMIVLGLFPGIFDPELTASHPHRAIEQPELAE